MTDSTDSTRDSLGWIGVGRMGEAMAARLLADGADLTIWNRTTSKCDALAARGATVAGSIKELAPKQIVFIMVTSSPDLLQVTTGPDGLLASSELPEVIVDCSTVSAEASADLRAEAAGLGVALVAAPISGNPTMVAEGAAAIVASGPDDAFERARPYLELIAPVVVHAGTAEESRLVKLCHNLLLGVITQALVEVTSLAEKGGISNANFLDFINGSVLGSTFIRAKGRAIVERDYTPTFTSVGMRKDYDLGLAAARALEVPMVLTAMVHQLVQTSIGQGHADSDYVSLYEVQALAAGLPRTSPS